MIGDMSEQTCNENLEQRIINAAKALFIEKGFSDTSMSEIAARVGINRPVLHYYFRTKEKMFNAVFGIIIQTFVPKIQSIVMQTDRPVADRVGDVFDAYCRVFGENPELPLFVLREIDRDVDNFLRVVMSLPVMPYLGRMKDSLLSEMDNGNIRRVPIRTVFITFYSLITFPFLARNFITAMFQSECDTFEDVLAEWRQNVIRQMECLLCVDKG